LEPLREAMDQPSLAGDGKVENEEWCGLRYCTATV
jgi:hypothetical protein